MDAYEDIATPACSPLWAVLQRQRGVATTGHAHRNIRCIELALHPLRDVQDKPLLVDTATADGSGVTSPMSGVKHDKAAALAFERSPGLKKGGYNALGVGTRNAPILTILRNGAIEPEEAVVEYKTSASRVKRQASVLAL